MTGIYKFENKINHHIYVGQAKDIERRYKNHISRAFSKNQNVSEYDSPLHCALRKYGVDNFIFEVLEECSAELLNEREIYWINFYNSYKEGYNCTTGGSNQEATQKYNKEFVDKIKQLLIENKKTYDEIHNEYQISLGRISEINTGKIWYDENLEYPLRSLKKFCYCEKCGKQISKQTQNQLCIDCFNKVKRKVTTRPNREELKQLIREKSFVEIGKIYSVSDNAIRKWCTLEKLPRTKKEINAYSAEEWQNV